MSKSNTNAKHEFYWALLWKQVFKCNDNFYINFFLLFQSVKGDTTSIYLTDIFGHSQYKFDDYDIIILSSDVFTQPYVQWHDPGDILGYRI